MHVSDFEYFLTAAYSDDGCGVPDGIRQHRAGGSGGTGNPGDACEHGSRGYILQDYGSEEERALTLE